MLNTQFPPVGLLMTLPGRWSLTLLSLWVLENPLLTLEACG